MNVRVLISRDTGPIYTEKKTLFYFLPAAGNVHHHNSYSPDHHQRNRELKIGIIIIIFIQP